MLTLKDVQQKAKQQSQVEGQGEKKRKAMKAVNLRANVNELYETLMKCLAGLKNKNVKDKVTIPRFL